MTLEVKNQMEIRFLRKLHICNPPIIFRKVSLNFTILSKIGCQAKLAEVNWRKKQAPLL
jgi:hypothetical protein